MSTAPEPLTQSATIDHRWFAEEVRPHEAAVRGYLRNRFPSVDADDVLQEAYLQLLRAPAAGKIASAKAYFFTIARNTARRVFRRNRIFSPIGVNELPDSCLLEHGVGGGDVADHRHRHALVIEALDRLPPRCREVVELAALHGSRPAEIAAKLGIAENTVRVQLARGVKACSDYMRRKGEFG